MSSRILGRNARGFDCKVEECVPTNVPQPCDPRRPEWQWPSQVNNPFRFAAYVRRLHEMCGLSFVFPFGAYQRFAGKLWKSEGPEVLCRAAYLAALRANHSFSPKFINAQIEEIPHKPTLVILF